MSIANPMARTKAPPNIQLIEAQTVRGGTVILALSRSQPGKAYVLELGDQGQPICPCPAYQFRGRCAHVDALNAPTPEPVTLPPAARPARQSLKRVAL